MIRPFAATALALGLAMPAAALDLEALTDAERAAFREEVRDYLLENPEVLMEAIGVLEQREADAQAANDERLAQVNLDEIQNDGYSFVGGNPDGDITLVEFMDYRCGYCRRAQPEVEELVSADGNIRYVIKEFPILGPGSALSSEFAIAVKQLHGDDMYKDVHDALIALRGDATEESLTQIAEGFGLDPAPILERMESAEVAQVIRDTRALAQRLQISGTPTFVFEDEMVRGYVPLAQMEAIVADIRSEEG